MAGGHGRGSGLHQLNDPNGVPVDQDGALLVVDTRNHRIVRWVPGDTQGSVVAGGHGRGSGLHQLDSPRGVAVDQDGALLVVETRNHRVVRWAPGATQGSVAAGGHGGGSGLHQLLSPHGVGVDQDGALLVVDTGNHRIVRWAPGATQGSVAAGGNGPGVGLYQLAWPTGVAVDQDGALLVADSANHRIVRWAPGATQGSVAAGGHGRGSGLHQLDHPIGMAVDQDGALLVADSTNGRIVRWAPGATQGSVAAGGHGRGSGLHQLDHPIGVAVDQDGALLVADTENHRVVRWAPGATQGSVAAGGHGPGSGLHQLQRPAGIAMAGVMAPWSTDAHSAWPRDSRLIVRTMLLVDARRACGGLASLGPPLLTHILPLALPARALPRARQPGNSRPAQQPPFLEDVRHTEPPATIDPETAAAVVAEQEAGFVERNLHAAAGPPELAVPGAEVGARDPLRPQPEERFSPVLLFNFTRHPPALEQALLRSEPLREVREALDREGTGWQTPHGTKLLINPAQVQAVRNAIVGSRTGASHVIVSESLAHILLAEVNALPRRHSVQVKDVRVLAYTSGGEAAGTVIVRNTFLQTPPQMLLPHRVVNSTTEAHRGRNPRRCINSAA